MPEQQAYSLEKEGQELFIKERFHEAATVFTKAAEIYSKNRNHKQAALCFASSAGAWARKSGEKPFYQAALCYEMAAKESEAGQDFEYASLLYKHAAINHEKDMDFQRFSDCFYLSKENFRKYLANAVFKPKNNKQIIPGAEIESSIGKLGKFRLWLFYSFSNFIWGHGEKPVRTLICAFLLVSLSAVIYSCGSLVKGGEMFRPDIFNAFYFSMVTFTTVGYGDMTPVGFTKLVVIFELSCGLFIMPMFIIALSRKYLRA